MEVMNQSLQYFQRQVLMEDREVNLQFAFLVTGKDLDPALIGRMHVIWLVSIVVRRTMASYLRKTLHVGYTS